MYKTIPLAAILAALSLTACHAHDSYAHRSHSNTYAQNDNYDNRTGDRYNTSSDYDQDISSETEDSAGTEVKQHVKVKVKKNRHGMKKTVEREKKVDPKGLMNSTTDKTTDTTEVKDGKTEVHHTRKVNGKTVEDTDTQNGY